MSAEIIGNALERKEATDQLAKLNEELKSFNSQWKRRYRRGQNSLRRHLVLPRHLTRQNPSFWLACPMNSGTPLNAIIGFSEVLREKYFGDLNEKQADYIVDIVDSGNISVTN